MKAVNDLNLPVFSLGLKERTATVLGITVCCFGTLTLFPVLLVVAALEALLILSISRRARMPVWAVVAKRAALQGVFGVKAMLLVVFAMMARQLEHLRPKDCKLLTALAAGMDESALVTATKARTQQAQDEAAE